MEYTGLTIDQELEMDQKLFGEAYYRIVNGRKERIDPKTLVKLTPNKLFMVPDQYLGDGTWSAKKAEVLKSGDKGILFTEKEHESLVKATEIWGGFGWNNPT